MRYETGDTVFLIVVMLFIFVMGVVLGVRLGE
jgi:hypothetical protein